MNTLYIALHYFARALAIAIMILMILNMIGCASWSHPTKSPDQFYSDLNDCERDFAAMQDSTQAFYAKRRCLMVKGWRD